MLTVRDVAVTLAVSERQVWRLIRSGKLAALRSPSGRLRVAEDALGQYIEANYVPAREPSTPDNPAA